MKGETSMVYVYCPSCNSVNAASIRSKKFRRGEIITCQRCGRRVAGPFVRENCKQCANILYTPSNCPKRELPCKIEHEQEAQRIQEKEASEHFSMLEIPCQNCPSVILRLHGGQYDTCPNCHCQPSAEYIHEQWRRLTRQEPTLIQWNDPTGRKLLHVDQRGTNVPPYSVLLVIQGQYVVYDGDSGRRTLSPRAYAMFKNAYTEAEKLQLLNENEGLALGLGTRIIFFSEQRYEMNCTLPLQLGNGKWLARTPLRICMQMQRKNSENLMDFRMDLTDDAKATESLESLVRENVSSRINDYILTHEDGDSIEDVADAQQVRAWLRNSVLTDRALNSITDAASQDLSMRYGIMLPLPVTLNIAGLEVERLYNIVEVSCTARKLGATNGTVCGHVNRIPAASYEQHAPIQCEACGAQLTWCPTCRAYVTTEKLPNVCDTCNFRIY